MGKVLIIGLDGVSPEILFDDWWLNKLPNIKKMFSNGVHAELKTIVPPVTAPAWASFATGKNPGKHGIFDFVYPVDSLDNLVSISSGDINGKTYYEILNEDGKKNILLNLPLTFPPKTNDIIITSILTKGNQFIFPIKIKEAIPEFKHYRIFPKLEYQREDKFNLLIEDVRDVERVRFECAKKLFERKWDSFFILFGATDLVQHLKYDEMLEKNVPPKLLAFFKEIDGYIGWFIDNIPKDANVFLMSDHGFRSYKGAVLVNNLLRKKNLIKFSSSDKGHFYTNPFNEIYDKIKKKTPTIPVDHIYNKLLKRKFLLNLSKKIYTLLERLSLVRVEFKERVSRSESLAVMPVYSGYVFLNRKGRFKDGKLNEEDYKKVLYDLKDYFLNLKDEGGKEVFSKVWLNTELYNGPFTEKMPDLIFESDDYCYDTFPHGEKIIDKKVINVHSTTGIFMAYGPDIKNNEYISYMSIMDIAPTILFMLGSKIPADVDGKVIKKIFKKDSLLSKSEIKFQKLDKHVSEIEKINKSIGKIKI